ncbi:hypothetical protein CVT25_003209 [Psilocybe cyanescens]|uniref:Uncharacterized protein n=1 Tax=Psilocybe cyanescens TaxID=93625 RepID=A0A409WMD3_PSICY|nr:hypothetical protein CVT25_003209 [Psilocybe cyanescens]
MSCIHDCRTGTKTDKNLNATFEYASKRVPHRAPKSVAETKANEKGIEAADDEAEKAKLSSELQNLRVELNYFLHYFKSKKYISLFPPEVRKGEYRSAESQAKTKKTDEDRAEVRRWIREQMEQGGLPGEPELELASQHDTGKSRAQKWPQSKITHTSPETSKETEEEQKDDSFGEDDDEWC